MLFNCDVKHRSSDLPSPHPFGSHAKCKWSAVMPEQPDPTEREIIWRLEVAGLDSYWYAPFHNSIERIYVYKNTPTRG